MHFSSLLSVIAVVLAWANTSNGQTNGFDVPTEPTNGQIAVAGTSLDIVWTPTEAYNDDTITFTLLQGATQNTLELGQVIASGISSSLGKYSWNIPKDLPSFAIYGFKLSLDAEDSIFQYSFPFHITGLGSGGGPTSTVGGATSTTTVTAGSSIESTVAPEPTTVASITVASTTVSSAISEAPAPTSQVSQSSSLASASFTSQPSQSTSLPTSSTSQKQTQASQNTSPASPTSSAVSPSTIISAHHAGLSTGAKAGIGIGATIGALLILGLIFGAFWFGTRHAAKKNEKSRDGAGLPELGEGGILGGEMNADREKAELAGTGDKVHEIEAEEAKEKAELEGRGKRVFEIG